MPISPPFPIVSDHFPPPSHYKAYNLKSDFCTDASDEWNKLASDYMKLTESTILPPVTAMLDRSNALWPFSRAVGILDDGCGPGPIMLRIIKEYGTVLPADCSLTCSDFSESMIKQVQLQKEKAGPGDALWSKVKAVQLNSMDLRGIPADSQSHVMAGMVFFMTPSPQKCLTEVLRVLQPEGVLALSSWEGSQWLKLMGCITDVRSDKQLPEIPAEWRSQTGVRREMELAGFRDVVTLGVGVDLPFQDHRSLCEFFLMKLPLMIAMTKDMSSEEVENVLQLMVHTMEEMAPEAPGKLHGDTIVGIGRK